MIDKKVNIQGEIPANSISCYIGRVVSVDENFADNGKLIVDFHKLDDDDDTVASPDFGESGSTYKQATASWTLIAAAKAWQDPPPIKYKGTLVGKGEIKLDSATISDMSVTFPAGTVTSPTGPCAPPFAFTNGTGTAKLSAVKPNGSINVSTSDLEIELKSDEHSQLPWCVHNTSKDFIKKNDKALCLAFGNSTSNLYVVDIIRTGD